MSSDLDDFDYDQAETPDPEKIRGKEFVLTGEFKPYEGGLKQGEYEKLLKNKGANINNKVRKKTDYLVAGKKNKTLKSSKSHNIKQAEKWNIPIISANQLRKVLNLR